MFVSNPSRLILTLGMLLSGAALTGCVGSLPVKNNLDQNVSVVQQSSNEISIYKSRLTPTDDGWALQGRLTRKSRYRDFSPGHIDLVVTNKQGGILDKQQIDLEYMTDDIHNPYSGRYSGFKFSLKQTPLEMGEIRVSHHERAPDHS